MAATRDWRAPSGKRPRHRRQRKPGGKELDWRGCWHAAVRTKLVVTPLGPGITVQWPAGGCSGIARKWSVMAQKRAPRALKWRPRQGGGVGWLEATRPEVLGAAWARIGVGGWWLE
jgi:hypothetical protein